MVAFSLPAGDRQRHPLGIHALRESGQIRKALAHKPRAILLVRHSRPASGPRGIAPRNPQVGRRGARAVP